MTNIENILEEIYKVDPSLKAKDSDIRKIVIMMLSNKPDVQIDEQFIKGLRHNLEAQLDNMNIKQYSFPKTFNYKLVGSLFAIIVVTISASAIYRYASIQTPDIILGTNSQIVNKTDNTVTIKSDEGIISKNAKTSTLISGFIKFKSETEYKEYIQNQDLAYYSGGIGGGRMMTLESGAVSISAPSAGTDNNKAINEVNPGRVSETNVQVVGIDEPDIVKTDGKRIYLAPQNYYYGGGIEPMRMMEAPAPVSIKSSIVRPQPPEYHSKIQIIKAFPAETLAKEGVILDKNGNLLLSNNILIILGDKNISGFDVADPKNPKEKWTVTLDDKNSFVQARLYKDQIYLITSTYTNKYDPCPIPLFKLGSESVVMPCTGIYHPTSQISVNATYHISTINVTSGSLSKKVSFVGSYDSTIYMSKDNLFVAYSHSGDIMEFFYGFMNENKDLFPQSLIGKIAELKNYKISESSKLNELQTDISEYVSSLSNDEELKFNNETQNRATDYLKKHKRDLIKTDIVKVGLDKFTVEAMGTIPGKLLNNFSLDEYNDNLRAAVTVGEFFGWGMGFSSGRDQENDVYVLDGNLNITGSLTGLGQDERIYSARFIEDKGYLVTFKQTDPFYVLDLRNPKSPQMVGELKIPGFSSYLHPITKDLILGVGMDSSKVKISLFDVSNPAKPAEISKYSLDEYWTEVSNNYHAFLQDSKHKVFFIPGSNGGYVFSYDNNTITLKKAVSEIQAKRALFIDDYLYVVGDNKIVILNENTWERVNLIEL